MSDLIGFDYKPIWVINKFSSNKDKACKVTSTIHMIECVGA
jgi:hypothetical protein